MGKGNNVIFCLVFLLVLVSPGFLFAGGGGQRADSGRTAITIWGPGQEAPDYMIRSFDLVVEEFRRRNPNVDLTGYHIEGGTDYRQRYDMAVMSGQAPAGLCILPPVDVPTRAKNGSIKDITNLVENWDLKRQGVVNPTFDEAMRVGGKWYAVMDTFYIAGTPYNKTALRAGGGDPANLPRTWAEFAALGEKISDPSVPRFGYLLLGMEWNAWPFTPWVWSAGGEMVRLNSDGSYRIAFNEAPGVDAAEFWNAMVWKHRMTQRDVLRGWAEYIDDMHSGRGVFGFSTLDTYTADAEKKYGIPPQTFGIMPIPGKNGANMQAGFSGGEVWVFGPGNSDAQTKAAWDFAMLHSYDPATMERRWTLENSISVIDSRVPARTDMVDIKYQKYGSKWPAGWAEEFAALSRVVKLEPFSPDWDNLKNTLAPYLQQIILKDGITRTEIQAILDAAAEECYRSWPSSFKK